MSFNILILIIIVVIPTITGVTFSIRVIAVVKWLDRETKSLH